MEKTIYRKNAGKTRGYPLLTLSAVLLFGFTAVNLVLVEAYRVQLARAAKIRED